ncbi:hypothetical protein GCM10008997_39590 [Halomonas salifodinae]
MFERLLGAPIQPSDNEMKPISFTNVRAEDSVAALAAKMCQGREFPLYLDRRQRQKFGKTEDECPDGSHDGMQARDWLCKACGVRTWSELDTDPQAAEAFIKIYNRFARWQARRIGKI